MTTKPKPPVEWVKLESIKLAPPELNPNLGDVGAIIQSIKHNDWYGTIEVNKGGEETNRMVLAGNHRVLAAQQLGWTELPVWWVDKTDDEAKVMLIGDNRSSALAHNNEQVLADMLGDLARKGMLEGTLFDQEDLNKLLEDIAEPLDLEDVYRCPQCSYEWSGKPRPNQPV